MNPDDWMIRVPRALDSKCRYIHIYGLASQKWLEYIHNHFVPFKSHPLSSAHAFSGLSGSVFSSHNTHLPQSVTLHYTLGSLDTGFHLPSLSHDSCSPKHPGHSFYTCI